MTNPKVSVIVPVYNTEKYLEECLASIQNQTLKDIEIICINDGSTDGSLDILEQYEKNDNRFVIIRQENQGAGASRNNGLKIARGDYLIFLDSDDFFSDKLLEKTYTRGIETEADIVLFGGDMYNCRTNQYGNADHFFRKKYTNDKDVFSRADIPERIMQVSNTTLWTKLYSRKFVLDNNLEFPAYPMNEDVGFALLSLCVADRISYVDEKLIHYRVGLSSNQTSRSVKYPTCFLKARESLCDELKRRNIFENVEKSYVNAVIEGCEYNLNTLNFDSRLEIYKEITSPEFEKTGVLEHPVDYYDSPKGYHKTNGAKYVLAWYEKFVASGLSDYERTLFEMYISDVDGTKSELREKKEKLQQAYGEKSELNSKLQQTYKEKSELNSKLQQTYDEKSELNRKLQQTYNEKSELNGKLQLVYEEKGELDKKLQQSYEEKGELNGKLQQTYAEKNELDQKLQQSNAEKEERGIQIKLLESQIGQLEEQLKALAEKEKTNAKALKKKKNECNEIRQNLKLTNDELKATKKELEKTKKSWSFRIGRVIMWLPGKIKRIFKRKRGNTK